VGFTCTELDSALCPFLGQMCGLIPFLPLALDVDANKNSYDWVRQQWIDAGVPASKLVLGVGGFGLVWGDQNGDGLAPIAPYSNGGSGAASGETSGIVSDNAVTQAWLSSTLAAHPGELTAVWDAGTGISYWHSASESEQVTVDGLYCDLWSSCSATEEVSLIFYETPQSMQAKLAYVRQHGLQGMMFWTLSQLRDGTSFPNLEALGLLFTDGFESGGTTAWSTAVGEPAR
jgi:chitinase